MRKMIISIGIMFWKDGKMLAGTWNKKNPSFFYSYTYFVRGIMTINEKND
jgi:hypothetical protein